MKIWLLILAAVTIMAPPFKAVDPGRLCVVETLVLEQKQQCHVYGGEWSGVGSTLPEAMEDMENTVPGKMFLRQVQRVIFCGETELPVPEEVPLGAAVYRFQTDGETLSKEMKKLEPILEEWEQKKKLPRVSDLGQGEIDAGGVSVWAKEIK